MGVKTLNDIFYKPDIGASGAVEKGKFDDGLDAADLLIEANKDAKHIQGTDQGLDTGGGNAVVVADVKDSVDKKHTQGTDQGLDSGGANAVVVADIKDAVTKKHSQNTDTDLDATFEATFVKKVDKLSVMAATSSAELAGKISDEMGAGKLRFDTSVTAKTAIATLNVNEAGIILVSCAVTPYTITLPTPIGNTGLKYKIKKTDYNYNLITFATVAGKFDFANDDGVLKDTYTRVNTPGAEVVFVADGANWQVIDEALGQVPECKVFLSVRQLNIKDAKWCYVDFNIEAKDIGNNYNNGDWVSGIATSTVVNHLADTAGAFTVEMVGKRVKNTTDATYTYITAYTSATDVTVRDDIFVETEGYQILDCRYIVPINGNYQIISAIAWMGSTIVADKAYGLQVKHGLSVTADWVQSAFAGDIVDKITNQISLNANDKIYSQVYANTAAETVDVYGSGIQSTFLYIRLVSKS